jgi:hypothetical protein
MMSLLVQLFSNEESTNILLVPSMLASRCRFHGIGRLDIANGLMGAKDNLFNQADAPVNILTCIQNTDKYLNTELFGSEKKNMMEEVYTWLSEFAHPNFCSNKSAFHLDKKYGRMIFRHDADLQESDFGLAGYMAVSAGFFPSLYDRFEAACEATLADGEPIPTMAR